MGGGEPGEAPLQLPSGSQPFFFFFHWTVLNWSLECVWNHDLFHPELLNIQIFPFHLYLTFLKFIFVWKINIFMYEGGFIFPHFVFSNTILFSHSVQFFFPIGSAAVWEAELAGWEALSRARGVACERPLSGCCIGHALLLCMGPLALGDHSIYTLPGTGAPVTQQFLLNM